MIWEISKLISIFNFLLIICYLIIKWTIYFPYYFRMMRMDGKRLICFILMLISTICAVRYYSGAAVIAFLAQNSLAYNFQLQIHFIIKFNKQGLHYITVKIHNSLRLSYTGEFFKSLAIKNIYVLT